MKPRLPLLILSLLVLLAAAAAVPDARADDTLDAGNFDSSARSFCSDAVDVPFAECSNVFVFFNRVQGNRYWTPAQRDGWNDRLEICTWDGIACRDGHITEIDRSGVSMEGSPDFFREVVAFRDLDHLEVLRFAGAGLTGQVPRLSSYPSLRVLDLADNELVGVGFFDQDGAFHGGAFEVRGDPEALVLEELYLSHNMLSYAIPAAVTQIPTLRVLDVFGNPGIDGPLPRTFMQSAVTRLDAGGTGVCVASDDAWQAWTGTLETYDAPETTCAVQYCASDAYDVVGIDGAQCEALVEFYASTGGGSWEENGGWLVDENTVLEPCEWDGVTCEVLDNRWWVTGIDLRNNGLHGELVPSISNLSRLGTLDLRDNALTGMLPATFGAFTRMQTLDLGGNAFTGPLPGSMGQMQALQYLSLRDNAFTGSLDVFEPGLPDLYYLWLDGNRFDGVLGSWVETMGLLENFSLSGNELSGSLPAELGELSALAYLDLSNNRFDGALPPELGSLGQGANGPRLKHLDLSANDLEGAVPASLGAHRALEHLDLSDNGDLSGCLPTSLSDIGGLESFYYDRTRLKTPPGRTFQRWIDGLEFVRDTGELCSIGSTTMCFNLRFLEAGPYVEDEKHFMFQFSRGPNVAPGRADAFTALNWNGQPADPGVRGPNGTERWEPVRVTCDDFEGSGLATDSQGLRGDGNWSDHLPGEPQDYYLFVDDFQLDWLSREAVNADLSTVIPRPAAIPAGLMGDVRRYGEGIIEVRERGTDETVLAFQDIDLLMTLAYPDFYGSSRIGAGGDDGRMSGMARARIDFADSDPAWSDLLDPEEVNRFAVAFESFEPIVEPGFCYSAYTVQRVCITSVIGDEENERPDKPVRLDGPPEPVAVDQDDDPVGDVDRIVVMPTYNENDEPLRFAVTETPDWMKPLDVVGTLAPGARGSFRYLVKAEALQEAGRLVGEVVMQTNARDSDGIARLPVEVLVGAVEEEEAEETATFSWQDLDVRPGRDVRIPIYFAPGTKDIFSFQLAMQFDMSYLHFSHVEPSDGTKGYALSAQMDDAGMLTLAGYDESGGNHPIASPVTLGHIVMKTEASAPKESSLAYGMMISGSVGDIDGRNLPVEVSASMFITASADVQLGGQLYYFGSPTGATSSDALAISGVKVGLFGTDGATLLQTETTDAFGRYAFTAEIDGTYTVRPLGDYDPRAEAALTATDAYTTLYAATGGIDFVEWTYRMIGDVNASATLDATDAYVTMSRVLGTIPDLSDFGLGDWAFVPASHEHGGSDWTNAPHEIAIARAETSDLSLDFVGGFYGDVNASGLGDVTKSIATLGLPDTMVVAGEAFALPLHITASEEAVASFDVELAYDPALFAFDGAEATTDGWHVAARVTEDGIIRIAGYERTGTHAGVIAEAAVPARLRFRALPSGTEVKTGTLAFRGTAHLGNIAGADRLGAAKSASVTVATSVANEKADAPTELALAPAFPNPFASHATVPYDVPEAGAVRLTVYDVLGREVAVLVDQNQPAGRHEAVFEARGLSSGVYLVRLVSESRSVTQRVTLAR